MPFAGKDLQWTGPHGRSSPGAGYHADSPSNVGHCPVMTDPRRRYALTQTHPGEEDRFFVEALDKTQWRPAGTGPEGDDWDTLWHVGMPPATAFQRARDGRLVNHIPGNGALTVKSSLADHIHRTRDQLAALYGDESEPAQAMDMIPPTYCLPRDRAALEAAAAAEPGALWLLKPANSARGQGIRLLDDPDPSLATTDQLRTVVSTTVTTSDASSATIELEMDAGDLGALAGGVALYGFNFQP